MSRQSRLIVILAVMALVAVVALMAVAGRYSRLIDKDEPRPGQTSEEASGAAAAQVDAFIRVRLKLRETIDTGIFDDIESNARVLAFSAARSRVLSLVRVHEADYRELRQHYRQWVRGPKLLRDVWREAFDHRRDELDRCDLGDLESLDR